LGLLTSLAELEWSFSGISVGAAILLAVGILVALGPVGWNYRVTIAGAALVVLMVPVLEDTELAPGTELRFPDGVGGPVALLRHGEKAVLFDARSPGAGYRARTRDRIFPWLASLGVERLAAVILSHPGVRPEVHWNFREGPAVGDLIEANACDRVSTWNWQHWCSMPGGTPRQRADQDGAGLQPDRPPSGFQGYTLRADPAQW